MTRKNRRTASRIGRFAGALSPLGAILIAVGCAGPPPSAPGEARAPERAGSYYLTRVSYHTPGGWKELPARRPVETFAGDEALEELDRVASRLLPGPQPEGRAAAPGERATRRYELRSLDPSRAPLDLYELSGPAGRVQVEIASGPSRAASDLEGWKASLLEVAIETLEEAFEPPRTPRDWQFVALAACLEPPASLAAATRDRILDRVLPAVLELADDSAQRDLCGALLPLAPSLPEPTVRGLVARDDRTTTRVLLLTHRARGGDRDALEEILTVALEYGGPPVLFARAMLVCFPQDSNAVLYASFPVETVTGRRTIPYLQHLRRHLDAARFTPSGGWHFSSP